MDVVRGMLAQIITSDKPYYTYALAYPDGKFFYIGKGKGYRIRTQKSRSS